MSTNAGVGAAAAAAAAAAATALVAYRFFTNDEHPIEPSRDASEETLHHYHRNAHHISSVSNDRVIQDGLSGRPSWHHLLMPVSWISNRWAPRDAHQDALIRSEMELAMSCLLFSGQNRQDWQVYAQQHADTPADADVMHQGSKDQALKEFCPDQPKYAGVRSQNWMTENGFEYPEKVTLKPVAQQKSPTSGQQAVTSLNRVLQDPKQASFTENTDMSTYDMCLAPTKSPHWNPAQPALIATDPGCYRTYASAFQPVVEMLHGAKRPQRLANLQDSWNRHVAGHNILKPFATSSFGVPYFACYISRNIAGFPFVSHPEFQRQRAEIAEKLVDLLKHVPASVDVGTTRHVNEVSKPTWNKLQDDGMVPHMPKAYEEVGLVRDWPKDR